MATSNSHAILFHEGPSQWNGNQKTRFIELMWHSEKKLLPDEPFAYFEFLRQDRGDKVTTHFTFQHVITVRDIIYDNSNESRDGIWAKVRQSLPSSIPDGDIKGIIVMVIKLLLMIRVTFCDSRVYVPPNQLPFLRDQNFDDVLKKFQTSRPPSETDRYPLWFNAIDLEKKAGLEIVWTDYITEHLTIQGKRVLLFRQIEALKYLERSTPVTSRLLSQDFITETMSSVLLFFPNDQGYPYESFDYTERFIPQGEPEACLGRLFKDSSEVQVSRLSHDYPVWHQRLAYILEVSKNPTDWSLKRLWYDDREESLWWAKWALITAVFLAIIFGLIQSITGIIQVTGTG
ncbi:hypothetical protein H9Q70_005531 [Fusarium xylarioides]|nr:hypothetical protein H9Q70_005531 [Fusarium xylarioides]